MRELLVRNLGYKILSVIIAAVLWLLIAREPEMGTSESVPVLFKNFSPDMEISSGLPDHVQLRIRGPARRLTPSSLAQTAVVLDLSGVQPGVRTFSIREDNVRDLPLGVSFYRAVPSQVTMHFERLATKTVPIEPVFETPPPAGYSLMRYELNPSQAEIRGPGLRVKNIDHLTTDPIDISKAEGTEKKNVQIQVGDPQVRMISPPDDHTEITIVLAKTEKGK